MAVRNAGEESETNVGTALKTLRTARGASLRSLAKKAGISPAALSRWETQKRVPNIPELEAVLAALEASAAQKQAILRLINAPRAVQRLRALDTVGLAFQNNLGGDLLWAMRKRRGWTQTETARAVGVTQSQIANWEHGQAAPNTAVLHALCWHLRARPEEVATLSRLGQTGDAKRAAPYDLSEKWDGEKWTKHIVRLLRQRPPDDLIDLMLITAEQKLIGMATDTPQNTAALALLADAYAVHARHHLFLKQETQAIHWARRGLSLVSRRLRSALPKTDTKEGGAPISIWFGSVLTLAAFMGKSSQTAAQQQAFGVLHNYLPTLDAQDPHYAWGQTSLAAIMGRMGRVDEAVALGQTACEAAERFGQSEGFMRWRDYARVLLDVKRPVQALHALHKSTTQRGLNEINADALARHFMMEAECYSALGDVQSADGRVRSAEQMISQHQLWYLQDDLRHAVAVL